MVKKKKWRRDANHWEKGDYSGAKFALDTVYVPIHQQENPAVEANNLFDIVAHNNLIDVGKQGAIT